MSIVYLSQCWVYAHILLSASTTQLKNNLIKISPQLNTRALMLVIKSMQQPYQMDRRSNQDQNMKDLMARTPNIESSGTKSFWNSAGIKTGSNNVEKALGEDMRKTDGAVHLGDAKDNDTVENGDGC